jgi:SAM-dependent methyltransferase
MNDLIQGIGELKLSYSNLCTEFYDLTKPEAGLQEVAFYEALLKTAKGPILEAMCGSGRLLIPLLKKGIALEGVDSSSHMLQSCQRRCKEQGLDVFLYNQPLQALSLPKRYALIFIAIGSFQLIESYEEAQRALYQLEKALLPGGQLVLETYVPWDSIKESIQGSTLSDQSPIINLERIAYISEDAKIVNKSTIVTYFKDQVEKTQTRYEKWLDDQCSNVEEEAYTVRWYHRFELKFLLEKAGFSLVKILDASFEQNEQAIVYIATKQSSDS